MAHRHRSTSPGIPHHLIHRGNNRRVLFSTAGDYWRLLSLIADASRRHHCPVHAAALMSNHLHLIVTPPSAKALSLFVASFANRYAFYRNRRREASGKLFEERFLRFPLETELALGLATAYIDLNPVRAGLVQSPEAHRWTTARAHLGLPQPREWPPTLWTPSCWYEGLGSTATERALAYREWLDAGASSVWQLPPPPVEADQGGSLHYALRLRRPDGTRAT